MTHSPRKRGRNLWTLSLAIYIALIALVWVTHDHLLLQPGSQLRLRYAPLAGLMLLHGVPGACALFLALFQFSTRLRQRHLQWHRVLGRIYVGCVAIAAPSSVVVAHMLAPALLVGASAVQAVGWLLATATGLYCIRMGKLQQHREWMMRSYPFAMVFIVTRAINVLPFMAKAGSAGREISIWACIAAACFLPSFVIEWQHLTAPPGRARAATS